MRLNLTTPIRLPDGAPAEVAAAHQRHDTLVTRHARARGAREDAREAAARAKTEDAARVKQAALAGKTITDPAKAQTAARTLIAALDAQLDALGEACQEAGQQLLTVIAEHRDTWLTTAVEARENARKRYDRAISEAKAAAHDLAAAEESAEWLETYSLHDHSRGQGPRYHHGRRGVTVEDPTRRVHGTTHDVRALLDIVATATNPEPEHPPLRGPIDGQPRRRFASTEAKS
jgi:hypothetical protein